MNHLQHYRKIIWTGTTTLCAAGLLLIGSMALAGEKGEGGRGRGNQPKLEDLDVHFDKKDGKVKIEGQFKCRGQGRGDNDGGKDGGKDGGDKGGSDGWGWGGDQGGGGGGDNGNRCDEEGIKVTATVKYREKVTCRSGSGSGDGWGWGGKQGEGGRGGGEETKVSDVMTEEGFDKTDEDGKFKIKVDLEKSNLSCKGKGNQVSRKFEIEKVFIEAKQDGKVIATAKCTEEEYKSGNFDCDVDNDGKGGGKDGKDGKND